MGIGGFECLRASYYGIRFENPCLSTSLYVQLPEAKVYN